MENTDLQELKKKNDKRSLLVKVLMWFIALSVVGCVVCIILGMLKVAIEAMVITAAILMFVALLCIVGYNRVRQKILEDKLAREERKNRTPDAPAD